MAFSVAVSTVFMEFSLFLSFFLSFFSLRFHPLLNICQRRRVQSRRATHIITHEVESAARQATRIWNYCNIVYMQLRNLSAETAFYEKLSPTLLQSSFHCRLTQDSWRGRSLGDRALIQ